MVANEVNKEMELFKKGIQIDSWGSVYVGLKMNWITPTEVIKFCEEKKITCDDDRFVQLYLAYEESLFAFLDLIKEFVKDDGDPLINSIEDSYTLSQVSDFPKEYWIFWEAEFLLRIVNSAESKETKLDQVASIHPVFNYPESWHPFLVHMPPVGKSAGSSDSVYRNLLSHTEELLKQINSR